MLSKPMRVTRPAEFTAVLRTGRRVGTKLVALHMLTPPMGTSLSDETGPARAGFVVSAAVGNSVVRHRVTRRLREQVRPLLAAMPAGTAVVVRAFPPSAAASSEQLGRDLRSALNRARSR
ncbi:MAG: ribonuclease P protein component [Nakamurella sp.]